MVNFRRLMIAAGRRSNTRQTSFASSLSGFAPVPKVFTVRPMGYAIPMAYCDENGTIAVSLEARSHGKGARITVSNTYMADGDVATSRFFERFYRQDKSHNSEKPGFGIGLSMAKEIVERMKGKLKASYSNQTIRFTIEI